MASPKSGRDYLGEFLPGLRNIANIPAESEALSQQMTHTPSQSPYQQFQQEYPEIDQYLRDVASGQMAYTGLQDLASNLNRSYDDPSALEEYLGFGGMTAFHGSPHKFGKFLMDKIGTGEGAQAYGHGLYFAESPDVAKAYSRVVSDKGGWDVGNAPPRAQLSEKSLNRIKDTANFANIEARYFRDGPEAAKQMAKEAFDNSRGTPYSDAFHELAYKVDWEKSPGSFYEVDIPDEQINKMLDWDAPLSEQPESVRKRLEQAMEAGGIKKIQPENPFGKSFAGRYRDQRATMMSDDPTGMDIYQAMAYGTDFGGNPAGQAQVSEYLKSIGIPGIKYFDQASRGAGEGTRNFVVFDEDIVKILERK